jgi:two-component system cell cycle response regulator
MMHLANPHTTGHLVTRMRGDVLVVDDDELTRAHLVSVLTQAGYTVHSAGTGAQALLMLSVRPCQIVVTDWEMPELDGPGLCRAVRLRDSDKYTYVLMLTVRDNPDDVLAALGAGADEYLVKGGTSEQLLARVEVGERISRFAHVQPLRPTENRRLTVVDLLTGAYNRLFLRDFLPRELARARRYGHPVAILRCEIDDFKKINDCLGQEAADDVLQAFVKRSRSVLRESIDWIARTGGEEFVLVLPETTLAGASRVAQKLRQTMAEQAIQTCAGPVSPVLSIGAAALETAEELACKSAIELLRAGEQCLRVSKDIGLDRPHYSLPVHGGLSMAMHSGLRHEIN